MFSNRYIHHSYYVCNYGEIRPEYSRLQTGIGSSKQGESREQTGGKSGASRDLPGTKRVYAYTQNTLRLYAKLFVPIRKTPCAYTQNDLRLYTK